MLHEFVQFDGLTCNGFLCYPVAKKVVPMVSKAQSKASNKYRAKAYDMIQIATPKGTRDRWRALAEQEGKSLTAYIVSRVEGAYVNAEEIIDAPASSADPAQEPHKGPSAPSEP